MEKNSECAMKMLRQDLSLPQRVVLVHPRLLLGDWLTQIDSKFRFNFGVLTIRIINYLSDGVDGLFGDYAHHGALPFQVVQGHLLVGGAQP